MGSRSARLVFRERLRLFLHRQFPEWTVAEAFCPVSAAVGGGRTVSRSEAVAVATETPPREQATIMDRSTSNGKLSGRGLAMTRRSKSCKGDGE